MITKEELKTKAADTVFGMGYDTYESDGHSDFAVRDILVKFAEQHIAELEAQNERIKSQYDYTFNQLCKSREILCSMLSQYRDRKEIDYSTRECGEKLLKEGLYKND